MLFEKPYLSGQHIVKNTIQMDDLFLKNKQQYVYLLNYDIDTNNDDFYLKYMLLKNTFTNMLELPFFELKEDMISDYELKIDDLSSFIKLFILNTFSVEIKDEYLTNIICHGFHVYNNNIYCLIDLTNVKFDLKHIHLDIDIIWFGLVNEIINTKQIYDNIINCHVSNFFLNNYDFLILMKNDIELQIPIEGYIVQPINKLDFTLNIGLQKNMKNNKFGPYYYFYNYKNAISQINEDPSSDCFQYTGFTSASSKQKFEWGILRYAIFLKTYKFIDNKSLDESVLKDILIQKEKNSNKEKLTLNITDYDGIWGNNYDSLHIGKIILDDDSLLMNYPVYVIKNESQYNCISYRYLYFKNINKI